MKTLNTKWTLRTYDVWGNAKDGYEVNDTYSSGEIEIDCKVVTNNLNTAHQFDSAHPSHYQIKKQLGITCGIETDGDDLTIYVNRKRDGKPMCELQCVSHASLSPIRNLNP